MERINLDNYEAYLLDYFEGNLNQEQIQALKDFALLHPELNIDLLQNDLTYIPEENDKADFKNDLLKKEEDLTSWNLIAYLEGDLSGEEKAKLEERLSEDADLARELQMFRKTFLLQEESESFERDGLIKSEDEFLLSNRLLLFTEGLLNAEQKKEFENDLASNKSLQRDFDLLQKTRLIPDASVVYPGKENLRKQARVIALFNFRTAAIAAAILLLVGLFVLIGRTQKSESEIVPVAKNNIPFKNDKAVKPINDHKENNAVNASSVAVDVEKEIQNVSPKQLANHQVDENKGRKLPDTAEKIIKEDPQLVQKKEEVKQPEMNLPENNLQDTALAVKQTENVKKDEIVTSKKAMSILPIEEDDDDMAEEPKKKGFWQRAANVARQANVLGMKAVNGEEKSKNDYLISFNSFSIEKK